jgi:L-ribulose-5-phosphate 3-epimerase
MNIGGFNIGVCSWSLKPVDMADLVAKVRELGLEHIQLSLAPLLFLDDKRKHQELGHLHAGGISLTGGMMSFPGEDYSSISMIRDTGGFVPEKEWPQRRAMTIQGAKLGVELGLKTIMTHVGFVPPSNHPNYEVVIAKVRDIAAILAEHSMDLLMETGQESATELLQFLNDLSTRNIHINFDPANMILYGAGDPLDAIRTLGRHIRHVHVKDAKHSNRPGVNWGEEVPFGTGEVDVPEFIVALKSVGYAGPLAIEREAGDQRVEDVKTAIETLKSAANV